MFTLAFKIFGRNKDEQEWAERVEKALASGDYPVLADALDALHKQGDNTGKYPSGTMMVIAEKLAESEQYLGRAAGGAYHAVMNLPQNSPLRPKAAAIYFRSAKSKEIPGDRISGAKTAAGLAGDDHNIKNEVALYILQESKYFDFDARVRIICDAIELAGENSEAARQTMDALRLAFFLSPRNKAIIGIALETARRKNPEVASLGKNVWGQSVRAQETPEERIESVKDMLTWGTPALLAESIDIILENHGSLSDVNAAPEALLLAAAYAKKMDEVKNGLIAAALLQNLKKLEVDARFACYENIKKDSHDYSPVFLERVAEAMLEDAAGIPNAYELMRAAEKAWTIAYMAPSVAKKAADIILDCIPDLSTAAERYKWAEKLKKGLARFSPKVEVEELMEKLKNRPAFFPRMKEIDALLEENKPLPPLRAESGPWLERMFRQPQGVSPR